jgi:predicted HTH transcriptional regulator
MTNPYNIEFLQSLVGQQETQLLEFKSSRELLNESADKRAKFIASQIVPAVSAFLNTDGGQIVIGIEEEKSGIATHLSHPTAISATGARARRPASLGTSRATIAEEPQERARR